MYHAQYRILSETLKTSTGPNLLSISIIQSQIYTYILIWRVALSKMAKSKVERRRSSNWRRKEHTNFEGGHIISCQCSAQAQARDLDLDLD